MNITRNGIFLSIKKSLFRAVASMLAACLIFSALGTDVSASAATVKVAKPTMISEVKYSNAATHPYNKQTNTLIVNWKSVKNAKSYEVYIKGGKYTKWTKYKTVSATKCTVTGLKRVTTYYFRVRAVNGKVKGDFSNTQALKTARFNYDKAGWEAMCRIVYHEVGQMSGSMWDKPIVYVADCVANQYSAAKYLNHPTWAPYYRRYKSIQDVIYRSGGFMSEAGLRRDGAVYSRVTTRVKTAVYGAVYAKTSLNGIKNDYTVYFWCNRGYKSNDRRIAYTFKIPWGYFNVWRSYWG